MRTLKAIAILVFGIAGCVAARAADVPERAARDVFTHHVPSGHRVGPIVIYDFQPGIVVRAYWASPWRHRHYFPFGAEKIDVDVSDNDGPPQPAENFERSWSTCDVCARELPPLRARDEAPRDEQLPPPAIKK
jgi:hypothetical protein